MLSAFILPMLFLTSFSQKYSTTHAAAVHLISETVFRSASCSSHQRSRSMLVARAKMAHGEFGFARGRWCCAPVSLFVIIYQFGGQHVRPPNIV